MLQLLILRAVFHVRQDEAEEGWVGMEPGSWDSLLYT